MAVPVLAGGLVLPSHVTVGQDGGLPQVLETSDNGCSSRYGRMKRSADLRLSEDVEDEIEDEFGGDTSWGIPENVAIVETPFSDHPVLEVQYPAGSSAPTAKDSPRGGAGFYAEMGLAEGRNSACLSYRIWFPEDFEFVRGGKLPGLFGGSEPPSGGDRPHGDDGFTVRLMWRQDGMGELYLYAPNMVPSSENGGQSLGRGLWSFEVGKWTDVELEVVLNNPGSSNGTAGIWIDGDLKMLVSGIEYRRTDRVDVAGLMFSTFFGGSGKRYAPSDDQVLYFDNFVTYGMRDPELDDELDQ